MTLVGRVYTRAIRGAPTDPSLPTPAFARGALRPLWRESFVSAMRCTAGRARENPRGNLAAEKGEEGRASILFGFARHREEVEFRPNNYAEAIPPTNCGRALVFGRVETRITRPSSRLREEGRCGKFESL